MSLPPEEPDDGPAGSWTVRPFLGRVPQPTGADAPAGPAGATDAGRDDGAEVRPFVLTRGRVVTEEDLAVEAQVVRTRRGGDAVDTLAFEYRDIVELCGEPLAVAEIAATLRLQLGVARVLVQDLTNQGMVTTFEPEVGLTDDVDTIMRVIHGLRQLS
jgi:Protein of unknown function (DUF742)